jgi:hypothetical protein
MEIEFSVQIRFFVLSRVSRICSWDIRIFHDAMNAAMDSRIPNTSTLWQLWYSDMFDRDGPASIQARARILSRACTSYGFIH